MITLEEARNWYPDEDPVHGFDHVLRVTRLAEMLGEALGADLGILRAAALLHDASGAAPDAEQGSGAQDLGGAEAAQEQGARASHERESAAFARSVLEAKGWGAERIEAVAHCIRAHRYRGREAPISLEAQILFDADKLDVLGAFGVARTIGYAMQAGQPVYAEPSPRFLEHGVLEPDEPHSAYHEYLFKLRNVQGRLHTEAARRMGSERHAVMAAFFEQLAAEAQGEI